MRTTVSVLMLAGAITTSVALCGEKVKLLSGFEPEQMKVWIGKKLQEKDGTFSFRHGRRTVTLAEGQATEGKHSWRVPLRKFDMDWAAKRSYVAIRYITGVVFNGYGRVGEDPRLGKKRSPWLPGDWSGYGRLRLDVKSTKAAARVRLHLFDQIALPPVQRVFEVPAGKWVTLDLDLARASQVHEVSLSGANRKKYGVKIAKVRTFNPAKMANFMVLLEKAGADTEFLMDNLRLVADAKAEKARYPLIVDARPYPEPKELLPSSPKPVEFPASARGGAVLKNGGKPALIDMSTARPTSYGRLCEQVRHGITSAGSGRVLFAQGSFTPSGSIDGLKSWKSLGNLRHSSNAPGAGVGAAGPDLLGFYVARCHGNSLPVDMFFRIAKFDGTKWVASAPYLADINSWHCPEFKVEILRLKSGRIWAVWMDCDRFCSYHNTLRARYSDDGGKFWRDPDSNGTAVFANPSGVGKPAAIGVTWWWQEPKITPPVAKANGHVAKSHPHTNFAITTCGDHLAMIYCSRSQRISFSKFDGEKWTEPKVLMRAYGSVGSATTLGDSAVYFTFKGKVYRTDGEKCSADTPAEKGCGKLVACAGKVVCIGKNVSEKDGQQVTQLWSSRKASGGGWSKPVVFATEKTKKDRSGRISIIAPQFAHDAFVPVAWAPKDRWIKVLRLPEVMMIAGGGAMRLRALLAVLSLVAVCGHVSARGGEKLLLGFEKDECWKLAGHKKEKGERLEIRYNTYGTYHYMQKGDTTGGEWALAKSFKGKFDPLGKGVTESGVVAVQRGGRLLNGYGWMARRKLLGDWSGFDRLRVDVKSTKSPALVRFRVADRRTIPVPERRYQVPAGKWCTLEFDLAAAAEKARLERISPKPGHGLFFVMHGSAIYPARVLNRGDVRGVFLNLLKCDAGTTVLLDNLRLVPAGAEVKSKHQLLTDKSPWPKPEILPLETRPRVPERPKGAGANGKVAQEKPVVIDMSGVRKTCYGRMHNDRSGIAVLDSKRMAINVANGGNRAVLVTADGGKTWKGLNGSEKATNMFRGRLMMVGACGTPAAVGSEMMFITAIHCSGGEEPSWIWFRRVAWNGKAWKADPVRVVDVESWHCPEHTMDLVRLPNGRIWGAWSPLSRTGGVIARYSDDDGKTWRALPGQLGTEGHGQKRPLLVPYGKGVACFFKVGWQDYFSWSHSDGKKWSKAAPPIKGLRARPICGVATGPEELFVAAGLKGKGKLLRLSGGKWSEEKGAPFVPSRLSASGGKLVALKIREGKLIMSVRDASGKWSPAKELAAVEKGTVDLIVPLAAPKGFLPVVWSTKAGRSINFLRVPLAGR